MEKLSRKDYTLKYAIPSLIITFLLLFLGTAGINTAIKALFKFLGWSMSIVTMIQWGSTFAVLVYFIYVVLNSLGIINRRNQNN